MPANLIKTLIQHLPRHAEEEGDFYSVTRDELCNALCGRHAVERGVAETTVSFCERLLDTLAALDAEALQKGEWRFVSFPAQLLAMSVLTALSDADSRFFEPTFWNTQDVANDKKERQREVLQALENRRNACHIKGAAAPIRNIYVAWGIIKHEDNVLFYQREDTQKRHDKKAGDYGLVGGRVNQGDVHDFPGGIKALLQELQSADSAVIKAALPETLKRELAEELGLQFGEHYTFNAEPWRSLKPYRQVQGAASNHALTEYYLAIFHVELTLEGYLFIQRRIQSDWWIAWFSLEEMIKGETTDGKIAYLNALLTDFDHDRAALYDALAALPDSFINRYRQQQDKYGLTFPANCDKPLLAGVLGKEQAVNISLTPQQTAILLGLAAHQRGFAFEEVKDGVILHPYGWVEAANNAELVASLALLAERLAATEIPIESYRGRLFRLSIRPDAVFFDDALFGCTVPTQDFQSLKKSTTMTMRRKALATALGIVREETKDFDVSLQVAQDLKKVQALELVTETDGAQKLYDRCRKALGEKCLNLGSRGMLRQDRGVLKLCWEYAIA